MGILALRTNGLAVPSIHDSMVKAFRALGVDISELPIPRSSEEVQDFKSHARQGYEAIFAINLGGDSHFISNLRDIQLSIRIPWIIWFVDDPEGYGFPTACEPDCTIAFCWDREITRQISLGSSGKRIPFMYLPLAVDPDLFYPEERNSSLLFPGGVFVGSTAQSNDLLEEVAQTTPGFFEDLDALWQGYKDDLRLSPQVMAWMHLQKKTGKEMGRIRADPLCRLWVHAAVHLLGLWKRREIVRRVIGPGGGVFGDGGWTNNVGDLYQGQVAYGESLREIYNRSAFVLDIRQPQARTGLTQRVFDASACGRPVLAEYSPELGVLFEPEYELLWFDSPQRALEMKKRFLQDQNGANKTAARARCRVLASHTYRHRADSILQAFNEWGN